MNKITTSLYTYSIYFCHGYLVVGVIISFREQLNFSRKDWNRKRHILLFIRLYFSFCSDDAFKIMCKTIVFLFKLVRWCRFIFLFFKHMVKISKINKEMDFVHVIFVKNHDIVWLFRVKISGQCNVRCFYVFFCMSIL